MRQHEVVGHVPPLRALIADDEAGARWHLRDLLEVCRVRTVAECAAGEEVLSALPRIRPDLLCLDVRLPDLNGVDVARRACTGPRPAVIFATGYADYAVSAFEVGAADYLVKPLSQGRVEEAVRRVRARLQGADAAPALLSVPSRALPCPRLFIPAGDYHAALAPEAIRYVEAQGRASLIHANDGTHRLRLPLDRLERALAPHGFLRTHRAYLVNLNRVRALVPWSRHVHTLLLDGEEETHVPVAKSRLAAFRDSVIWIPQAGAWRDGPGAAGQGRTGSRSQPGTGPGDRGGSGG